MNQRDFYNRWDAAELTPLDPTVHVDDYDRLTGQNREVLTMLRHGPKTNVEFVRAGIYRYSARIYDLRQRGYKIETRRDEGGRTTFTLEGSA